MRIFKCHPCQHLFWGICKEYKRRRGGENSFSYWLCMNSDPALRWMTDEGRDSLSVTLSRMPCRGSHFFYSVHPPTAARDIQDRGGKTRGFVHFKVTKIRCQNFFFCWKKNLHWSVSRLLYKVTFNSNSVESKLTVLSCSFILGTSLSKFTCALLRVLTVRGVI